MPAVRMMRVCAQREGPDDGDLLGDQRQVRGEEEPWIDDAEDDDRDHQHDGGADRGVAVQDVAQPASGCAAVGLLGQVEGWGRYR